MTANVTGDYLEDRYLYGYSYSDPNVVSESINEANGNGSPSSSTDKIICVELFRQGLMSKKIFEADEAFRRMLRKKYPAVLIGYQWWASLVVKQMKKSKTFTQAVYFIAKPWSYEMAYQMGEINKGSLVGKFIMYTGFIVCWLIGSVIKVTIPVKSFNPETDSLFYKDSEGTYRIVIGTKDSWKKFLKDKFKKTSIYDSEI